jgi:hypothetical protein
LGQTLAIFYWKYLIPLPFGTECGGKYCQYIGKLMIGWSGDIENYCKQRSFANISTALCAKGQVNNFIGNILLPQSREV